MSSTLLTILMLAAALALFWVSTRQFHLAFRLLLWAGGCGLAAAAAWLVLPGVDAQGGLLWTLGDFASKLSTPQESVLAQSLNANAAIAARHIPAFLQILVVGAGVVALACLAALTPGEAVERVTRPVIVGLVGMMCGAGLALGLVTLGYGGPVKQRVYLGAVTNIDQVHDGDTFRMGDIAIRLNGVDAPELKQPCFSDRGVLETCAEEARQALFAQMREQVLLCKPPGAKLPDMGVIAKADETFGRPILECETLPIKGGPKGELGKAMIQSGYAIAYRGTGKETYQKEFQKEEAAATQSNAGLMRACWLDPKKWRRDPQIRAQFEACNFAAIQEHLIGDCANVQCRPRLTP